MAARSSLSREPSPSGRSITSLRTSLASDANVFGDEHALASPAPSASLSTVTSDEAAEASTSEPHPPRESTIIAPYPQVPMSHTAADSISKRPLPIDDTASTAESGLDRSLSTSTRFSLPRAQSPYNGPTAPSHPYAMYQQGTRASSITSESTLRPHAETPFVPRGGPEHPYALYTQNTVPEEEEDITAGGIPIGFPRSLNFQSSSGGSNNSDVGDIVGSDGHVEQLPPYTRYADNTVAKGNMDEIHGPQMTEVAHTSSTDPLTTASSTTAVSSEPSQPREVFDVEGDKEKETGWRAKAKKRTCGGMPMWVIILVVIVVILAGVLGGVIGGVVGNSQGSERARTNAPATETVYLDATPTTVAPNVSPIPTGSYTVPLNETQNIGNCIADQAYSAAWDCLQLAYINMTIQQPDPTQPEMQAVFQDFSMSDFEYGPQPPDFNGTAFPLTTMVDKDNTEEQIYGAAAFFSVTFDKLIIVDEMAIPHPGGQKRWVSDRQIKRRASYGKKLVDGDKPWFCFWNSTVNEFWIYLEQPELPSPTSASPSSVTSMSSSSTAPNNGQSWSGGQMQAMKYHDWAPYPTTFVANFPPHVHNDAAQPTPAFEKRGPPGGPSYTLGYPRVVKMVEKRMPGGNIPPYCQQMEVIRDDGSQDCDIVPVPNQDRVMINEIEFNPDWIPPSASGNNKLRRDEDVQEELQSRCVCEWMTQG